MDWFWPLQYKDYEVPQNEEGYRPHNGAFATKRKYDTHTGVDLYTPVGTIVKAVEDGVVVAIEHFTGAPESPWWNSTDAVLVEGASGVVVYGEIMPSPEMAVGKVVKRKEKIGSVLQVLKKSKEGSHVSMLHMELHKPGTKFTEAWVDSKPETLLDPTPLLLKAFRNPHENWNTPTIADALSAWRTPLMAPSAFVTYTSQWGIDGTIRVTTNPPAAMATIAPVDPIVDDGIDDYRENDNDLADPNCDCSSCTTIRRGY